MQLAERYQPPGREKEIDRTLNNIKAVIVSPNLKNQLAIQIPAADAITSAEGNEPTVALSIRQPHVEAIFRGIKKIEYRREATSRRGRILIYSAKLFAENLDYWVEHYGFQNVDLDELPRGYVVGSVELYKCEGGDWHLRNPVRAKALRRPAGRPQPIWFRPFE